MTKLDIPKSWSFTNLFNICDIIRGVTYKKSDSSDIERKRDIGVLRANNINYGLINYQSLVYIPQEKVKISQILKNNDVLIAMSSGSIKSVGKTAQFKVSDKNKLSFGAFCSILRLNNNNILSSFFGWYFQTSNYYSYIRSTTTGTNINNLKISDFEKLVFPLPPYKEQQRIVKKVESCFDKIDSIEKNLSQAEILLEKCRQSILNKAFCGKLVPQDSNDESASVLLDKIRKDRKKEQTAETKKTQKFEQMSKEAILFDIPNNWKWTTLGEINKDVLQKKPLQTFTYIDINSIDNKLYKITNQKVIQANQAPSRARKVVEYGDIVYSSVRPYLKNIAIVPKFKNPIASTGFCILKKSSSIQMQYVFYYLTSDLFLKLIEPLQKGANYPAVNDAVFYKLTIPLPPYKEQQRIVQKIESCFKKLDAISSDIALQKKALQKLRKSILQKAFQGQLVPQIKSEGTGQQLLKQILTERKKQFKEDDSMKLSKKTKRKGKYNGKKRVK